MLRKPCWFPARRAELTRDPQRYGFLEHGSRPKLAWPNGARLALWIVVNHEFYEFEPPACPARPAWSRVQPDILGYSRFDYGNRAGIGRILRLLEQFGLRASLSVNVAAIDRLIEPTKEAVSRGWEVLAHGVYNTRVFSGLSESDERAAIEYCVERITRHTGSAPRGWMGPLGTSSERTLDLLPEYGFTYTTDLFHEDEPFPVRVRDGRLISVPYTQETNDWWVFDVYGQTAGEFRQIIIDQFDCLYRESEQYGRVMCVSLHPYIVGHPHRLSELRLALEYIRGHSEVWYATGVDIADWYYEHYYTQVMATLDAQK